MENEVLLKEVTAKAQVWLGEGYDAETRAEVRRMLDSEDKTDLIELSIKIWNSEPADCAVSWVSAPTV